MVLKKFDFKKFLKEWVLPFALEATVIFILFTQVLAINNVPSPSMVPTVKVGQIVLSFRRFDRTALKRGDIVTFQNDELEMLLIKRLIGLPGDHVEIRENEVIFINGEQLTDSYATSYTDFEGTFDVPEGHYFFLGDNRAHSYDARDWNEPYIAEADLVARAFFTFWPLDNVRLYP